GAAGPLAPALLPVTLRRPPRRVGRQAEWEALHRGCAQGQAVLVEGEAGMGKSRLLADWLPHAGPWLGAAGRPGDAGVPYATLARLMHPLLQAGTPALDDPARLALAPLWQPGGTGAAVRPDALAAAVAALLAQAQVRTVCLDDLHFTDDATIDLVAALARSAAPPVWLLARRPAEGSAAAARLVDTLAEEGRLLPLRLQPLAAADVALLIDDLALPAPAGTGLAEPLCRHTGGNPLFLLETLKQGLADGSLARGELPRPDGVGVLIERRLLRLSAPALTLARVAAIAGIDFSIELAEAATGQPAVQLAGAWQELQDAQVLRDEAFAHDLVADVVLRGVPQVVARRVHAQCAQWLAAHRGEPARVARHWQLGGQPAEAALAYRQAAERALRTSRRSEEAALLMQAARCHGEAGDAAQRFDALAKRALALVAAQIDEHTLQEVQDLEAQAVDDRQRVQAIRVHLDLLGQHGQFQRAAELGLRGLGLARALGDPAEQARLAAELAGSLSRLGRCDEALDVMRPQQAWVDAEADDETRHLWYGYWASTLGQLGRLRDALASYQTSIAAAERLGRRDAIGAAVLNQGVVLRTLGRLDQALACSRRGVTLKADDPVETTERTLARLMHARDQADTGHFAEALQAFDDIAPRLAAMGGGFWTVAARTAQAQMWLHLGQMARARQALADDDAATPVWMRAGRHLLRMEIAQWLQQPAPAGGVAQALALAQTDPARQVSSQVRALRASPAEQVLAEVPALAERARAQERFGVLMALRTHEARAALHLGNTARAAESARAALALHAEGFAPEFMYGPEPQLVAWQALQAAGAAPEAEAALQAGAGWVRLRLAQVPAPFLDSFLNRNPVNRALLAAVRS
ncbi:MAG: AAA family ATPase, partial [Burkholderiales bacterium]|nr:AAA family ATPase [Burkholderiales bacterium]